MFLSAAYARIWQKPLKETIAHLFKFNRYGGNGLQTGCGIEACGLFTPSIEVGYTARLADYDRFGDILVVEIICIFIS